MTPSPDTVDGRATPELAPRSAQVAPVTTPSVGASSLLELRADLQSQLSPRHAYVRFWRGATRADRSPDELHKFLNDRLIPETTLAGGGKGLDAYLPVLLGPMAASSALSEVALVVYRDEASYKSVFATERGKAYGAAHGEIFDSERSGSIVPKPYAGTVSSNGAYLVRGNAKLDWQTGTHTFSMWKKKDGDGDGHAAIAAFIEKMKTAGGLRDAAVLVGDDHVLVYGNWKDSASARQSHKPQRGAGVLLAGAFDCVQSNVLASQDAGRTSIESGSGVHVRFDNRVVSGPVADGLVKNVPDLGLVVGDFASSKSELERAGFTEVAQIPVPTEQAQALSILPHAFEIHVFSHPSSPALIKVIAGESNDRGISATQALALSQHPASLVLASSDPRRAVAFYRKLGFPGDTQQGVRIANTTLTWTNEPAAAPRYFTLQVKDLDATVKQLALLGIRPLCPPQGGSAVKYLTFRDPDGHLVELLQMND